ncbi:hypothetical protein OSB04_024806 [Centaurea solstitialis]|uniref:Uncharacterized protein n=1 Tax=Centaurea solstitialis TaxID=347529 RepID=A0AA38SLV8_9ASTR|nr:hypothetical protein OSB04_024806 [Centaurea solstitialis]
MAIPQENRSGELLSKSKRLRGKTRCIKLHKDVVQYGVKHMIEFDDTGNFKGKYKSEIFSFLGSFVRKEVGLTKLSWKKVSKEVKDTINFIYDEGMKKLTMHHLADALRNFRSKMYQRFILPNIGKPSKLKVVPKQYGNIEQADWDKFVEDKLSDQFKIIHCTEKGLSELAKASRAKHKARQTKDGGYENDEIKDKVNHEKEIYDGSLKLEHGIDSLTLALGKKHHGSVRGVSKGMTPTRYWNIPRCKRSSRNCTLQRQLDDEKKENAEKVDLEVPLNASFEGQNSLTSRLLASHGTSVASNLSNRSAHDKTIAKSSKRPRQSSEVDYKPVSVKGAAVAMNSQ